MNLARRSVAEALGTALLLATIIGSGITGETLSDGNAAVALLANTLATGAGLATYILVLSPISGAHFNPVVSMVETVQGKLQWEEAAAYITAQISGALAGVAAAHMMFDKPLFFASQQIRAGIPQLWSEFVATFGLLYIILACVRHRPLAVPFAVGAYITAAYWFTASTSFANPAVTIARALSDTFAGIRPIDAPAFILAQILGAGLGLVAFKILNTKNLLECDKKSHSAS